MLAIIIPYVPKGISVIYLTITFLVVIPSLIMYIPEADISLTRVPEIVNI